jgi:hypothetical protein
MGIAVNSYIGVLAKFHVGKLLDWRHSLGGAGKELRNKIQYTDTF